MRFWSLTLSFLLVKSVFGAECDLRSIMAENASVFPPNEAVIAVETGGGGIVNPYFNGEDPDAPEGERPTARRSRLLKNIPDRDKAETEKIISDLKAMMIAEISGSGTLTPDQQLMINRVNDLKVNLSDCSNVEGSNDSITFEVSLCKNALKMPKLALVSLLAHEIGHSLDLCGLGSSRFHNHRHDLNQINSALPATAPVSGDAEDFTRLLSEASASSSPYLLDTSFSSDPQHSARFSALVRASGMRKADNGIPLTRNPLAVTYQCISGNNNHFNALTENREELCRNTDFSEGGAQIWASRLTGRFVAQNPPQSKTEALGLLANFVSGIQKGPQGKEHEMNSIFLSEPSLQRIFNCTPKPTQTCMNTFDPSRSLPTLIGDFNQLNPEPVVQCQ